MPAELRQVKGHALYRYVVSAEGTIGDVTELYATTEPASLQAPFTAVLRDCLRTWRYKPAGHASLSLPTQLLIAFHYFEPAPDGAPAIKTPDGRSIPRVHFDLMRKERITLAKRLLEGPDFAEIRRPGWTVMTNVAPGQRQLLVDAIERVQLTFTSVFAGAPSLPESSALTVFLFRNEEAFNQVAAFDNLLRMKGGIAGQYSPYEQTAYASLGNKPQRIAIAELVHEVTHHLVHQRLFQDGRQPPYWVNEGIATFFELLPGGTSVDVRRFERGKQAEGVFRWEGRGGSYLKVLSREAKGGTEPELGAFLSGSFGPMKSKVAYGLSWLIVHFLVTSEHQAYRLKFQDWLLTKADAGAGDSVLTAVGLPIEEFRRALSNHRKQLEKAAFW